MHKKSRLLLVLCMALALVLCISLTALAEESKENIITVKLAAADLGKMIVDDQVVVAVDQSKDYDGAIFAFTFSKALDEKFVTDVCFSVAGIELIVPAKAMQTLSANKSFNLSIKADSIALTGADGKALAWYDYQNPLQLSLPYKSADTAGAVLVKTTGDNEQIIPRSWYNNAIVSGKIYAAGSYAAKPVSSTDFADTKGEWMMTAVDYMSARAVVAGVGNNLFAPNNTINKAEFITMLMRALNVKVVADADKTAFADQAQIPDWAIKAINTAQALGLTIADADNNVNANAAIVREDMFLYAYQAMSATALLPEAMTMQFIEFKDWDAVSENAADAIQALAILKLANGWDGNIVPQGTSTRAQAAQFLYNILMLDQPQAEAAAITKISDLAGKTIAVPTGSIADDLVKSKVTDAVIVYFDTTAACLDAVAEGKADAAAYDEPVMKSLLSGRDDLLMLEEMITNDDYGYAVALDNADLKKAINDLLAELKKDGTYDEMIDRWFAGDASTPAMPKIDNSDTEGTLTFATAAITAPFSYLGADKKTALGFDIEFATRLAAKLGMELEIVNMDFAKLLTAVADGEADFAGACITISAERAKIVSFSNAYYQGGIAAAVAK